MDEIREDLWQTSLDVEGGANHCGYLLLRPEGNVLFYNAPDEADFGRIAELGGIGHPAEAGAIEAESQVDVTFDRVDGVLGNIDFLHTPGHTEGATLTRSLLRLRDLAPDLVLSSASLGERTVVEVEHDRWVRAVEETAGRPPLESP